MRGGYRVEADMEMHEIKYFLAACRTLNFHRAAELSHVSQPALTRAVQKLEAELGGHLFHRERNQIRVTDFGRLMRSHLEQVLRPGAAAERYGQGGRAELSQTRSSTAHPRGDVHNRAAALCRVPERFPRAASWHRGQRDRERARTPFRAASGRHARHCPDGSTKPVRCEAQCGANLLGAFRLGLPGWPSI